MRPLLALLSFVPALLPTFAPAAERPNFVIVLADDLGYGDLSCYGNDRFETPHLDRMAADGLRFTDFHSNCPVCSPTRAALLTGRYQQRAGIPGVVRADPKMNRHHGLHVHETTFAELLKKAGYATAVYGKWHVGYDTKFNPIRHGFDDFRGYVSGNVDYQSHVDQAGFADWWHRDELTPEEGYSTHLISRHAVRFVEEHAKQPFCLYVAHEAPHYPLQGPDDPAEREVGGKFVTQGRRKDKTAAYAEMVRAMDEGIGDIRAALAKHGIAKNTLVFFLSDNGATPLGSCGELRGNKGSVWEGGHRVPAIACWPGRIEAGGTSDHLGIGMDLMPTMLELAEVDPPTDRPLDGISLGPAMFGEARSPAPRTLAWEFGAKAAIRQGKWKLVASERGQKQPALFDLESDLGERKDVAAEHPEIVTRLTAALDEWRKDVADGATQQPERP